MELTYHGLSCVRLRGREMTVVVDPPQAQLPGLARSAASLVVRTEGVTDPEKLRPRDGHVQEVSGPGAFEARGVSVFGRPGAHVTARPVGGGAVRVGPPGRPRGRLAD